MKKGTFEGNELETKVFQSYIEKGAKVTLVERGREKEWHGEIIAQDDRVIILQSYSGKKFMLYKGNFVISFEEERKERK